MFKNHESHSQEVLIVGAGIAGLSIARQFQKLNIPYRIIEKRSGITTDGAGIALPANAIKALRYMGLGEQIEANAHRVNQIIYTDETGKILSQASLDQPLLNHDWFAALHRHKLHEILLQDIKDIQFDTTVEQIHFTEHGASIKFNYSSKREEFSAIIGADGVNSRTRRLIFPNNQLMDLGVTIWRWTCQYDTSKLQPTYLLGPRDIFMVYPISPNEVYCYAHMFDPDDVYSHVNASDMLRKSFAHYGDIVKEMLTLLPEHDVIVPGRLRSFTQPEFAIEKIALIGDASHACSPMLQQGAASSFEDAIVLSELMNEFPLDQAFLYYESFRKERVCWTLTASDGPIKSLINVDEIAVLERNKRIHKNGPLNVLGWQTLFTMDPLAELQKFIAKQKLQTQENSMKLVADKS